MVRIVVGYGSQTGKTMVIAQNVKNTVQAACQGHEVDLVPLDEVVLDSLEPGSVLVVVTSSFCIGGPPDNAASFNQLLVDGNLSLSHLKYAVLGSGHSQWFTFCGFSRFVDQRLSELGAERLCDAGEVDDATGSDLVSGPWTSTLCEALHKHLSSATTSSPAVAEPVKSREQSTPKATKIDRKTFQCPILAAKYLSASKDRRIIQLELNIEDTGLRYKPGDCISIYPKNNPNAVDALLKRLGADGNTMVPYSSTAFATPHVPKDTTSLTLRDALLTVYDFQRWVSDPLVDFLKTHTTNPVEKEQLLMITENMKNPSSVDASLSALDLDQINLPTVPNTTAQGPSDPDVEGTLACPCNGSCKNFPKRVRLNSSGNSLETDPEVQQEPAPRTPTKAVPSTRSISSSSHIVTGEEAERILMTGRVSFPEILALFPSCKPPATELLSFLPYLSARPYSISCSPLVFPNAIHIVFTANDTHLQLRGHTFNRRGVATSFIEDGCKDLLTGRSLSSSSSSSLLLDQMLPSLCFTIRTSTGFTLPDDLSQNILMIGAGTGIAPFRSFLQHLCYLRKKHAGDDLSTIPPRAFGCDECPQNLLTKPGKFPDIEDAPEGLTLFGQSWLFFGCRHPKVDCLFREELEVMQEMGALTKLELAFSRMMQEEEEASHLLDDVELMTPRRAARQHHKYVQHILKSQPHELYHLLSSKKGTLFVCGSMEGLVKDTHQQLVALVQGEMRCSEEEAEQFLRELEREKRYIREAWV